MSIKIVEGKKLHEFRSDTRRAEIYAHRKGYVVRLFENQVWKEDRVIVNHTEEYAENCAENFVSNIF
ncbi:MAG TPA: hypothetical protein DCW83_15900 [Saprospirales bacterium]|jgi:hypothetical protein|nr:hypothetical protein [Saprospirales bacterium]